MKRLVHGHAIGNTIYDFPHMCPGEKCAISQWLLWKHTKGITTKHTTAKTWRIVVVKEAKAC